MNAVIAKWTTDVTDPPIAYIEFNDTWFTEGSDIQFTFKFIRDDYNPSRRDTAWIRRNTVTFIDVHMWIRFKSVDTTGGPDTNYIYKCKKAFEDIIELNNSTLLPPAVVTVSDVTQIEEHDYLEDTVHYKFSVDVWYDKVKVDV